MPLTTLVVCEAGADKLAQIEALVAANADLELAGSSKLSDSLQKIRETNPSLVWIELTPNPAQGIKLLSGLKETHPEIYCLVSNEDLDAGLVKQTMQSGAIDFLDAKTWQEQLPDVIRRIKAKEAALSEEKEHAERERERLRKTLEHQRIQQPTVSKTNLAAMKKMVTDSKEIESRATMNFALIVIVVLIAIGGGFLMLNGGGH